MNEIIIFFLAAIISFWGSLQLGPVNVCVIQTALAYGKRQAFIVATGGVLPEIIYASLAVWGANFIEKYPTIMSWFGWVVVILLFVLGIYYFIKPYHNKRFNASLGAGFVKGFLLALFNPQLLPFWLGVLVYLKGFIDFGNGSIALANISFVLGTAAGAWFLLMLFIWLAITYKEKLNLVLKRNLNKIVGCLFILMAIVELVRRLWL